MNLTPENKNIKKETIGIIIKPPNIMTSKNNINDTIGSIESNI